MLFLSLRLTQILLVSVKVILYLDLNHARVSRQTSSFAALINEKIVLNKWLAVSEIVSDVRNV